MRALVLLVLARIAALLVDILVLAVPVFFTWKIFKNVLSWAPEFWVFSAFSTAVLLAYFESAQAGQTPGNFMLRLQARSLGRQSHISFEESITKYLFQFLWIAGFLLIVHAFDIWYGTEKIGMSSFAVIAWIAVLFIYPLIRTAGQVGLHDVVAGTACVWLGDATEPRQPQGIRREVWYCIGVLAIAHVGWLTYWKGQADDAKQDFERRGLDKQIQVIEEDLGALIYATHELGAGIENLFSYYDDLHGYIGTLPFNELDRTIGIQRPGTPSGLDELQLVPVFQVFVTSRGLLSNNFHERVGHNLMKFAKQKRGIKVIVVEFVYRGSLFELVFPVIVRRLVVLSVPEANRVGREVTMTLTPRVQGAFFLGNQRMPDFQIGSESIKSLQRE